MLQEYCPFSVSRKHVAELGFSPEAPTCLATSVCRSRWFLGILQELSLPFIFFVDDIPIRVFKNSKDLGVRFPFNQPMKLYSSLWNADDWATRGGLEKTNWANAPFVASYRQFHVDGCEASANANYCATQGRQWWDQKEFQDLDGFQYRRLRWVRNRWTIYNYCTDRSRSPMMPAECRRDRDI